MHLVDRPWSSGMYQIQQQWGNYPFDRNFIWNNQHPNSALPIYIESTPKAEGFKQTNRSNMHQQTHTYKHTAGTNREHIQWDWCRQSPSECRRITVHQFTKKKTKQKERTTSTMTSGTYLHFALTLSISQKSPPIEIHLRIPRSVSVSSG